MAIHKYKPTSPGRRGSSVIRNPDLSKGKPEKSLLITLRKSSGRNAHGRITSRRRGGGHKRQYRIIDWRRRHDDVPAKVAELQYDPYRSANVALLHYVDGKKSYIIAPAGLKPGWRCATCRWAARSTAWSSRRAVARRWADPPAP
jgi:large subunit ribosomal protein L2